MYGKVKNLLRVWMNQSLVGRKMLSIWSGLMGTRKIRKRIQREAALINLALANSPQTIIRVINDNSVSPATYGNFMEVIMLARFFAASGCHVRFEIEDSNGRRADWDDLDASSQVNFLNDQMSLAQLLLPEYTLEHMLPSKQRQLVGFASLPSLALFPKKNDPPVYAAVPYLLHVLSTTNNRGVPAGFLLDKDSFPINGKELATKQQYIAWHIRRSSWDLGRNTTDVAITSDFLQLRNAFPRHSIMLFSTQNGVVDALHLLSNEGLLTEMERDGLAVVGQPETGFASAIPWVLGSDFYFQRNGGGMGIVPIYSTMPYLQINSWESYYYGHYHDRLVPWAMENQQYIVHPDAANIPISEILNTK